MCVGREGVALELGVAALGRRQAGLSVSQLNGAGDGVRRLMGGKPHIGEV